MMKDTTRFILFMCLMVLFFLLGVLNWFTFSDLKDQLNHSNLLSQNTLAPSVNFLGIWMILTFILVFLSLIIFTFYSRSSHTSSQKIEKTLYSPKTTMTQMASSLGELIAEQKRIEEELRSREEWLSSTLKSLGHAVITTNSKGNITFINPMAEQLTGWKSGEAVGRDISEVYQTINEETRRPEPSPLQLVERNRANIIQSLLSTKEGQIAIDSSVAAMSNSKGERIGVVLVFRDITEEKQKERRIKQQANIDELTGLANRRYLIEKFSIAMELAQQEKQKLAVIFMDLDRFKSVNDSLGHEMGDLLLKGVGDRLRDLVGKKDIVSRIAGDEFVIILSSIDKDDIDPFAQRLLDRMREPFMIRGYRLVVTPSFGITFYPNDGKTLDDLLKKADEAMYSAKNEGKNGYRFYGAS